jgi:hypothetical protein
MTFVKVLFNTNQEAVLNGYIPGDKLVEEYVGTSQALAIIWSWFSQDSERGIAWDMHRRLQIGKLPSRNIRPGDIAVVDEVVFQATLMDWQPIRL